MLNIAAMNDGTNSDGLTGVTAKQHTYPDDISSAGENKSCAPGRVVCGVPVRQITAFDCAGHYQAKKSAKRSGMEVSPVQPGQTATPPSAIALPARLTFCRRINSPFKSERKTSRIIDSLLDVELPFAVEQCVTTTVENRPENGPDVMVTGCKKNDLTAFLNAFGNGDPLIIDHQGLALWTGSLHEIPPRAENTTRLVIWLDAENACVAVGQGTFFIDAHPLRGNPVEAFNRLLRHYADKLESNWEGMLAGELSAAEQWKKVISERGGQCTVHDQPQALLARAVARRALYDGPYRCNLHPAPETNPWVKSGMRKLDLMRGTAAAGIALLIGGLSIFIHARASALEQNVNLQLQQLADETAGFHVTARGHHRTEVVRRAAAERRGRMLPLEYAANPPVTPLLKRLYREAHTAGLRFSEISVAPQRISLNGQATGRNATESLKNTLQADGWRISRADYQNVESKTVFSIEAQKP